MIVLTAIFAGIFPDIVDKPLAWTFGVLPSGRMFMHSILLAIPLVVAVLLAAYWTGRLSYGVVFTYGHLTHIAGDFYPILTYGTEYYYYPNLFWPYMKANPGRNMGFGAHVPALGPELLAEFAVLTLILTYVAVDISYRLWVRRYPSEA